MSENESSDSAQTFDLIAPGTRVHKYEVGPVIGTGAMGVVYRAYDIELERDVALKFLASHLCASGEDNLRFRNEAQSAAGINHPNVITIHEVSEFDGTPFIVMEYAESGSLGKYVGEQRLTIEKILELLVEISEGIAAAHQRGIVHRDIKPNNILINSRGRAKIADFGLAAVFDRLQHSRPPSIQGTAPYMSPEQIQRQSIDYRTDLYSLGALLHEIVTGTVPFKAASLSETFQLILESMPRPLSDYRKDVPVELQRIAFKLLEKNPERRYQHAEDVTVDLRYTLEAVLSGRARLMHEPNRFGRSIAVLPFCNLSTEAEQEYFCEGISEDITNALTKVRGLHVVARSSAWQFKDSSEDVKDIGRKLHVDALLEGSVRRSGDRLRISVRLVDVVSGFHVWSERYDRDASDIFAVQDEISRGVVKVLRIILSDDEQQAIGRTTTSDAEAYDYYLRGRQFYHRGTRKGFLFALEMFRKAVEIDSDYALAYCGIADCCAYLVHLYGDTNAALLAEAGRVSERALELDPGLPQAHASRGFVLWLLEFKEQAVEEFEHAIRMDPSLVEAFYLYGRACFQGGEFEQAVRLFEGACQAREHHEARYFAAQTYSAMKQPDQANAAYSLAIRALEKHTQLHPDDARAFTMGAVTLCRLGEREAGIRWAEMALGIDPDDPGIQYNVACLYALEGEIERALRALEKAVAAGFAHRAWVENDPDLDSLREEPRFKNLPWRTTTGTEQHPA